MKKAAASLIFVFFLIIIICAGVVFSFFQPLKFKANEIEIHVAKGSTYKQAIEQLSKNSISGNYKILYLLGVYKGIDKKLKYGYYIFKNGMTQSDIYDKFVKGDIEQLKIAIIPGTTLWEIASTFSKLEITDENKFWQLANNRDFLSRLDIKAPSLEGYLFPATYTLVKGIHAEEAVELMVKTLRDRYPADFYEKAQSLGMTEQEIITLASIVEREAVKDCERAVISSVYHNRLKINMPLQADPTAIYGIKRLNKGVLRQDYNNNTPYNTYIIRGLPPGAIAIPSIESINAALNPTNDPYLYFVAKGDGTHTFSSTYEEHLRAVRSISRKANTASGEKREAS
ncbi:Aminodeoxychorismate lyase [Candidatus Magnetoovum chiemensis]|nr:Aminodeoxychorismate lyase [Candidatus Magnetoovum chiemensis]